MEFSMKLHAIHWCYFGGLIFLFLQIQIASNEHVYTRELSSGWNLTNQNGSVTKTKVKIPTGIYSALYGEDVLKSYNDVNLRWVAYDNWTYKNTFAFNWTEMESVRFVNLTFHGIDTIAEIRLNHFYIGRTDNMFVRYSYDVTRYLVEENFLEIEFKSPVFAAAAKANALKDHNITVPPECPNQRYHGECNMNMLRKMQASFAWDWGLAAPSMGIWKSVTLEHYEVALIRDIDVAISKNDTHWNMHVRVFIDAAGRRDFYAELTCYAVELLENPIIIDDYKTKPISYQNAVIAFEQAIPINSVTIWWPNGYGVHKLYPLYFTLNSWLNKSEFSLRSKSISQKTVRVGFRTIELIEDIAPANDGNTFLFKVNGMEMFMKGSNYIPSHILPELAGDEARIKHLLFSAKEAHMNMLRVWGGGIYESDYFYNLADEYGILIWQDMMFACAMYPVTNDFLSSVRTEVIQNAKRIAHHPSVAVFATNNENEVALAQNWYHTWQEKSRFDTEYRELYLATINHELKIVEHSTRILPLISSPSNGKISAKDNYLSDDPQDTHYGDIHFYDVLKDGWDPNIYPHPRFASEYGFQSLPQMQSWSRILGNNDNIIELISHRQHHPLAMIPITTLIRRHLPLPLPEEENYAEGLIYLSQIAQAMSTKIETQVYRSLRDTEVRTMGALYWQLNDVWVAPSWSSIDFYGSYKLLHYWARDFMDSITIIALYNSSTKSVNIFLTCDELEVNTKDLKVFQNIYLWSELYVKNSMNWSVTLKPNGVHHDKVIPVSTILTDKFNQNNCFVEYTLQRGSVVLSRAYYFPSAISSAVGVSDPEIEVEISSKYCQGSVNNVKMNSYSLSVIVKKPAIFVYIEIVHKNVVKYKLSRNGYMQMAPTQVVQLEFEYSKCVDITRNNIKILTVNQFMI
ncbi:beta-mannosidase-like [Teleopsis dalmanni]|uniref:beta-mannosidase-like n=1 Tax=Teleopsis dalmanni TaxID=139649 RepID=UPI0018CDF624|nr:beta-mannosidase-like [Teleopsis dalmanni]